MHPPFLLGLIAGGAVIYWFTGASAQAVTTGAYRAVEFIKKQHQAGKRREGLRGRLQEGGGDLHAVRAEGHVEHLPGGLLRRPWPSRFVEPFFFIGYLISIALFGLYQAIFMANAGGAWDNAKKVVETELSARARELHAATVVGDTVGDPFKDTCSVALNPIIKFTTLFGLLAVSLAVDLTPSRAPRFTTIAGGGFLRRSPCSSSTAASTACGSNSKD